MQLINQKKLLTLLLAFLICSVQLSYAQPSFISPATCIPAQDTFPVNTPYTINIPTGTTVVSAAALGDLQIVSTSPTTFPVVGPATLTVTATSRNIGRDTLNNCVNYLTAKTKKFGFGRGVIRVSYTTNGGSCGNFIDQVINKTFKERPPIVGPRCVAVGDTVTYSVCSILSVNQNANIGIDTYTWNQRKGLLTQPISGLLPVYTSGDNSSVTFLVQSGFIGGTLIAKFGVCNALTDSVAFTIGLKTNSSKIAIFSNGTVLASSVANNQVTCIPTGTTNNPISLAVNSPVGTYTYTWSSNNPSWSFSTTTGTTTNLTANESAGIVYVTASGGCDARRDTFYINRNLIAPLQIKRVSPDTIAVPCIPLGTPVTFTVTNASNSANTNGLVFRWTPPAGWSPSVFVGGPTAIFTATAATATSGNVTVTADPLVGTSTACNSTNLTIAVNIKPAKPSAITGTFCINQGSTTPLTYSIPAVTGATSYTWTNSATGWTGTSATNSITYLPTGNSVGTISVRANSNTCPGDTVQRVLNFNPVIPTNITQNCIPGGIACTTVLSAVGGAGTYEWIIPAGLGTPANTTGQTPTINTIGTPGSYSVQVRCTNVCGSTAYFPKNIVVSALPKIDSTPGGTFTVYSVNNTGACTPTAYCWRQNNTGACVSTASNILLQNGGASNYTVQITYAGCGATLNLSTPTKFSSRPTANGISNIASLSNATINPNPAKDAFTIALPATSANTTVSIYNSKGALVKQQICKAGPNKFNTSNWANGEYIIKLSSTKGETVTKKLMVNK